MAAPIELLAKFFVDILLVIVILVAAIAAVVVFWRHFESLRIDTLRFMAAIKMPNDQHAHINTRYAYIHEQSQSLRLSTFPPPTTLLFSSPSHSLSLSL